MAIERDNLDSLHTTTATGLVGAARPRNAYQSPGRVGTCVDVDSILLFSGKLHVPIIMPLKASELAGKL